MLSVFLVYCVPALGVTSPPVLLVGVNPAQSLPFPAVPVSDRLAPSMVSGAEGTSSPRVSLRVSITSLM